NIPFYLHARILQARTVPPDIFVVTDGDVKDSPAKEKQWRIVRERISVPPEKTFALAAGRTIEDYLLSSDALSSAFPARFPAKGEVEKQFAKRAKGQTSKELLIDVLRSGEIRYTPDTAAEIARSMKLQEIDAVITSMMSKIGERVAARLAG